MVWSRFRGEVQLDLLVWMTIKSSATVEFLREDLKESPFVKGDLEGFSSAQHHFDETDRAR
jgi:hypothetical protein